MKYKKIQFYIFVKNVIMRIILFIVGIIFFNACYGQQIIAADCIKAPENLENIHVQKISSDSLVSTFVIFIKEKVAMHKHAHHSENVYVLEGEGSMTVGEITKDIKAGDIIFIPENTFHEVTVTSSIPLKVISIQAPEFDGTDRILYLKN